LDAGIGINHELAISNHVLVEISPQHIGVKTRGGSTLKFLNATFTVPDDGNDVGCLSLGILNLPGFLLWRVCIHKRQADIALRHDDREERLCLKTNGEQFLIENRHAFSHIVATGSQCPTEGVRPNPLKMKSMDEIPDDMWRLPSMRGEAESYALIWLEGEAVSSLSDEIRDAEKCFVECFSYLLSHPFCVACA
jgi:hypothetical protein